VKWQCRENDHNNGGYGEEVLREMFEKYGHVITVIVSMKKNGLGIVEFHNPSEALIAMEFEHGFSENPLKISWLQGSKSSQDEKKRNVFDANSSSKSGNDSKVQSSSLSSDVGGEDFERLVLLRMKMAQKNKDSTVDL